MNHHHILKKNKKASKYRHFTQQIKSLEMKTFITVSVVVFILSGIFSFITYLVFHHFGLWNLGGGEDFDVIEFHAVSLSLLTIGLIASAYVGFSGSNKNLRGEFLIKIDKRFGNDDILRAESMIHALCAEKGVRNIEDEDKLNEVSRDIANMAKIPEKAQDFIRLLNFLDFLETIAYLANQDLISAKDVHELLGGTLLYYYKIFGPLMRHQREYLKQPGYYRELRALIAKNNPDLLSLVEDNE